ncbi:hypothetical protein [Hydrogenimonas sp.]
MKIFEKIPLLLLLLLWGGCVSRVYEKPISALVVFRTPTFAYADQGFVYRGREGIKVQIYVSGKAAFELKVGGKRVCLGNACMRERAFYRKYLHTDYPEGTLAAIFSRAPIFGGEGLEEKAGRFVQRIEEAGRFDIIYAFDSRSAKFRDRLNRILIKMTEIP